MRLKTYIVLILCVILTGWPATPVRSESKINIVVKTVLASQDSKFADPRLSALISELESVFRYSSYRLLSQDTMSLGMGKSGTASLPEGRMLKITPMRIKGNRVELQLAISQKNRQIFQTVIQLLNRGTITVGGPKYRGGYLLFNISNSF